MEVKCELIDNKLCVSLWDYETLVGGCILDQADELSLEDIEQIGNTIIKLVRWELEYGESD